MRFALCFLLLCGLSSVAKAAEKGIFELQCFTLKAGGGAKYEQLVRTAGLDAVKKVNVKLLGAWKPVDTTDERLFLLFNHDSKEQALKAWESVKNDPNWTKANSEFSQENGNVVAGFKRIFLDELDFGSNLPAKSDAKDSKHVYELRTYISSKGNLPRLHSRFRDHTVKLFEQHGMTNLIYWAIDETETLTDKEVLKPVVPAGAELPELTQTSPAKENTLIYFLVHDSVDAAKTSFGNFRVDPVWKKALEASEKDAGGSLTAPKGVFSFFLTPCDFSPLQ